MRRAYATFCLTFFVVVSQAHQSYHFILGSEELSGIDVYGIIHSDDSQYWITTNKGLFNFDGYDFKKYSNLEQKRSSLFNPTINYSGEIYCNNLSGQIFKVVDDEMILVHTVPDSLLGSYMSFNFLPNNQMIVSSKSCYRIIENQIQIILSDRDSYEAAQLTRKPGGQLLLQRSRNAVLEISENGTRKIPFEYSGNQTSILTFIYTQRGWVVSDTDKNLMTIDSTSTNLKLKNIFRGVDKFSRIYITGENLWVANNTFGVRKYEFTENELSFGRNESPLIFDKYFISYVFEDHEGNILLGTFGDGIIVIPKTEMDNIEISGDLNISRITSHQNGGIFLGSSRGQIYEWRAGDLSTIFEEGIKHIEILDYFPEENRLIFDQGFLTLPNLSGFKEQLVNLGSIKDVKRISDSRYVIGTNNATKIISLKDDPMLMVSFNTGRTYAISYDKYSNSYLVATSNGLLWIDSLSQLNKVKYGSNELLINDLEQWEDRTLIATQKFGVLEFEDGRVKSFLNTDNGLLSNNVRQLKPTRKYFFIATEEGFQVFYQNGNLLKTIGGSDGLLSRKIQDFDVDPYYIWFLHQSGLQKMKLSQLENSEPSLKINEIRVYSDERLIDSSEDYSFDYDENKIKFRIAAPTLAKQKDVSYAYRLDDIEGWNENLYFDNEIEYRSLASGEYAFEVLLKYKGKVKDRAAITFSISPPYWQTWWFILASALSFVLLTYLFFRKRLKDQELSAHQVNELNASKLAALQSQMNPHFIFNALNSIQEYIMLNERKLAGKYLGKFADLMRIYLHYSQIKNITIKEEMEALNLYLDLEKLRFEESLSYEIVIDENVDQNLLIPSLLVQPYIENALKHGLLHREKSKLLNIQFTFKEEHDTLECLITDNGIGRKRSIELNRSRDPKYQSFARGATKNRLKLLNHNAKKPIGEETIDLYDDERVAIGTKVILTIPIVLKMEQ